MCRFPSANIKLPLPALRSDCLSAAVMAPIYLRSTLSPNASYATYGAAAIASNPSPFGPIIQIIVFFIGTCIVPTMTAHTPIPLPLEAALGQTAMMIFSPVSSAVGAFHSIVIFVAKIFRGNLRHTQYHDGISAGAYAIYIPIRYEQEINNSAHGWRRVEQGTPISKAPRSAAIENTQLASDDTAILYSLPPLTRLQTNPPPISPTSSRLKASFAVLQLMYAVAQAYLQYEPINQGSGLSSPFIIALSYLHASFVGLVANLVQGSYSHVTVLPSVSTPVGSYFRWLAPKVLSSCPPRRISLLNRLLP